MNLDEYIFNIFDNKSSSFCVQYSKRTCFSDIRVYETPFYYTGISFCYTGAMPNCIVNIFKTI